LLNSNTESISSHMFAPWLVYKLFKYRFSLRKMLCIMKFGFTAS